MSLFTIEKLRCSYELPYVDGHSRVVLEIRNLQLDRGEKIFIVGESGIGKSTILETLGMMNNTIVPDASTRFIFSDTDGTEINLKAMWEGGDDTLSQFRLHHYSFIFQSTNLIYTRMLQGYSREETFEKTREVLTDLGLEHIDDRRMAQELSGGQQQRLAFARAILPDFTVLFGDEPTGNLDQENAMRVMQVITKKIDEHEGASAIIVSHDMHLATAFADTIIKIRKEIKPKKYDDDENVTYGVIDDRCVFHTNSTRNLWHCGNVAYKTHDFEKFLLD